MTRYDTILYDTIRYDAIRCDTIRYDTIHYTTGRWDGLVGTEVKLKGWRIPSWRCESCLDCAIPLRCQLRSSLHNRNGFPCSLDRHVATNATLCTTRRRLWWRPFWSSLNLSDEPINQLDWSRCFMRRQTCLTNWNHRAFSDFLTPHVTSAHKRKHKNLISKFNTQA